MSVAKVVKFSLLQLCFVLVAAAAPAWAACSGVSPNLTAPTWADVAACHTAASDGDTITVTAGSYTVTTQTTITKYVKIVAGGVVTLTDNTPNTTSLIDITESTAGHTRLDGFTITQGTAVHNNPSAVIYIRMSSGGQAVLIHANSFTNTLSNGDFIIAATNQGVIWANTHTGYPSGGNCLNNSSFVRHKPALDTTSWTRPSNFGTADTTGTNNLYIEGNTLYRVGEGIDVDSYGRTVFRYNTSTNHGIASHGNDTSGVAGGRYFEAYNNTFIVDDTPIPACGNVSENRNGFISLRGGTALIHDNVLPDPSGGTWGPKSAVIFNLENLRRNAGGFPCWGTVTAPGSGYPVPRQTGWGYVTGATTVTGTSCPNCPIQQDIEPIYLWNNTGTGNYNAPAVANYNCASGDACPNCSTCPLIAAYVESGREYFTSTAKPAYTPYQYPHPLTGGTLAPPTRLIVR
jgi:hypothetical protein